MASDWVLFLDCNYIIYIYIIHILYIIYIYIWHVVRVSGTDGRNSVFLRMSAVSLRPSYWDTDCRKLSFGTRGAAFFAAAGWLTGPFKDRFNVILVIYYWYISNICDIWWYMWYRHGRFCDITISGNQNMNRNLYIKQMKCIHDKINHGSS